MLKMRLQRVGRKNNPSYRVVVTDSRNAQIRGRHVDIVGNYDPRLNRFEIDAEAAKKWLSEGVQPSDTMYNLLVEKKIIEGRKKNVLPRKSIVIDEAKVKAEAEAKAAAEKKEADAKAAAEAEAKAQAEVAAAPAPEAEAAPVEEVPATPETPVEVPESIPAPTPEEQPETPVEEPKA
jgi:small subunit ribosomal protein S16